MRLAAVLMSVVLVGFMIGCDGDSGSSNTIPVPPSPNARELVIVNSNVGYLFSYDLSTSWVIDPSPVSASELKTASIDLSAYNTNNASGVQAPNPVCAVVDGNNLYVLLERSNGWYYDVTAKLLVFDISVPENPVLITDHDLIVVSPNAMVKFGTDLYIAGWGVMGFSAGGQTPNGGIEKVDLSSMHLGTISSSLLVDDDDGSDSYGNAYTYGGATMNVAIASLTVGFIYIGEWNTGTYEILRFNPTTGVVETGTPILDGINLAKMAVGPDGNLYAAASAWYGLGLDAGIYTIDVNTLAVTGPADTGLEPIDFSFFGSSADMAIATAGGGSGSFAKRIAGTVTESNLAFATTDLRVRAFGSDIYVLASFGADWLVKFNLNDLDTELYQYSVK